MHHVKGVFRNAIRLLWSTMARLVDSSTPLATLAVARCGSVSMAVIAVLAGLSTGVAPAQAAIGATEIGHFDVPLFAGGLNVGSLYSQAPHAPVFSGSTLFVPLGSLGDGLISFDLSDPTSPRFLGQFTGVKSRLLAPSGNLLYSVDGGTLNILDTSNPSSPLVLGTLGFNGPGTAATVAARGTLAFVTGAGGFFGSGPAALFAVDASDPAHPHLVGSAGPGGLDLALSGTIAYVASLGDGLRLYDISNPMAMRFLGSIGTLGDAVKVRVVGTTAYVYNTGPSIASLTIVNVADPAHPSVTGVVTIPFNLIFGDFFFGRSGETIFEMQVSGHYAFLCGFAGVVVVDVSNPAAPVMAGSIGATAYTGGIALKDDLLVLSNQIGISVLRLGAAPVARGGPDLDSKGNLILNGSSSSDADGTVVAWRWHLQNRDASSPSYDFTGASVGMQTVGTGVYQVSLVVQDDSGNDSDPLVFPLAVPSGHFNNGRAVGPPK